MGQHGVAIGVTEGRGQVREARAKGENIAPPHIPRAEVIDELIDTVQLGKPPVHDGAWARATTEACLAILQSASDNAECLLHHQVPAA